MGADGRFAAYTGTGVLDWCGHWIGDDFSVAGNMLAGPQVVDETVRVLRERTRPPFAAPPDRRDQGRREGRRRQARQAVGGAA